MDAWSLMRGDAFIHFVSGSRRVNIRLGVFLLIPKSPHDWFTYACQVFPGLTMEKLKADIFDSPQIRQLIRDPEFENSMNEVELEAWKAFVLAVKNFLGNNKARNNIELVNNKLTAFRNLGGNMSVKMHYRFSHMDRFPENLGSISDEQRKRFYQDLKEVESRYIALKFEQWWSNMQFLCITFINAHHSVYSNRCFYKVINKCCWQNIFWGVLVV